MSSQPPPTYHKNKRWMLPFQLGKTFGLMLLIIQKAWGKKVFGYLIEGLHTYLALIGPVANPPMTVQKTVPVLMPVGNGLQKTALSNVRLSVPDKILVTYRLLMPIQPIQSIPILKQCTKFVVQR